MIYLDGYRNEQLAGRYALGDSWPQRSQRACSGCPSCSVVCRRDWICGRNSAGSTGIHMITDERFFALPCLPVDGEGALLVLARSFLILPFVFILALIWGMRPEGSAEPKAPSRERCACGWVLIDGPLTYTKKNLLNSIDGQAVLYIQYGFQVGFARYGSVKARKIRSRRYL